MKHTDALRDLADCIDHVARRVVDLEERPTPANGVDGLPGPAGERGLQGEKGAPGEPGPAGRDGAPGEPGAPGAKGDQGERGERGEPGPAGERGERGLTGPAGERGPQGEPGLPGRDGRDGANGRDGATGPAGRLHGAKAWSDGVHYEGDIVTHAGSTYQAQRDTGHEPPHEDWTCLASRGSDGRDARSLEFLGAWRAGEAYQALSVVALNGASFVATRDEPGPCPGDGWRLMAAQGKRGEKGERGERGERGAPGPAVAKMTVDEDGLLTLFNADGTTVTCDLYPVLVKLDR